MRGFPAAGGRPLNAGIVLLGLLLAGGAPSERLAAATISAVPAAPPDAAAAAPTRAAYDEIGVASWYGGRHQGRRTASGARFDTAALTAAHRSLPFGTVVRVENFANGRRVALRITDRGPYVAGRIIDLSQAAARCLGLERRGVGLVGLTILPPSSPPQLAAAD